jgi:cytochrome P450
LLQTVVTSCCYCYHFDPEIFPEPEEFRPERWLCENVSALESRYLPFSRGPRSCVGLNLAYAELYLNFSYFVRKYDLTLFDTSSRAMEWTDNFVVKTREHLKVVLSHVET